MLLIPVTGIFGLFKCRRCVRTDGIGKWDIFRQRKDCQTAGDECFKSNGVFSFSLTQVCMGSRYSVGAKSWSLNLIFLSSFSVPGV